MFFGLGLILAVKGHTYTIAHKMPPSWRLSLYVTFDLNNNYFFDGVLVVIIFSSVY